MNTLGRWHGFSDMSAFCFIRIAILEEAYHRLIRREKLDSGTQKVARSKEWKY